MYDKAYAAAWIADHESRQDTFRVEHVEPRVQAFIRALPGEAKILDIGCGWGLAVESLKEDHEYTGIDPTDEFFPYIKSKHSERKLHLLRGKLPHDIDVDDSFDAAMCSMVLHCVEDLESSVRTVFSRLRHGGQALIIDFNDSAEQIIRADGFRVTDEDDAHHISGIYGLPSGVEVCGEIYFHKENDLETEFAKYGPFMKESTGPLFVSYIATKSK